MTEAESVNELHKDVFAADDAADRAADPREARKKAMDYLARREYGHAELCRKLSAAGFTGDAAETAVERLAADGLQDDRRFVEAFIRSRIEQGKGLQRIQAELGERGIDAPLVDDVATELDCDWFALAREVRHKKFGTALPATFTDKARQMRFLQYRGFRIDQISAAVDADDD